MERGALPGLDAPTATGGFEERLEFVRDALQRSASPFIQPHEHQLCRDTEHLRSDLRRIEALGGEGLMLREPGSKHQAGRSSTLLKVKTFHDAEAVVIAHEAGAGRHKGRLGALLVQLPSGIRFSVGTGFSERERASPPALGTTITFRYQELSDAGVPRFPSYVGVRCDATQPSESPPSEPVKAKRATRKTSISSVSTVAAPPPTASAGKPRYFEFISGSSSKFWEISSSGCELTTRWGRIGSAGQSKSKAMGDEAAVAKALERLITEKMAEGYVEK